MNLKQSIILTCSLATLVISCKESKKEVAIQKEVSHTQPANVFEFETPLCYHTATFDTNKYTKEELQATLELWISIVPILDSKAYRPEDYYNLDAEKLERDYKESRKYYENLKIVPLPFWENYRKEILRSIDSHYELSKITLEAHKNPDILLNNKFTNYCSEYADVLASEDTLAIMIAWHDLAEKQAKNSVEGYWQEHSEKRASASHLLYAKMDLMTYGWWNCANNYVFHTSTTTDYQGEFEKLFIKVTSECDE